MNALESIEIKAFVPAKDFDLSKQFYQDLGFNLRWSTEHLACMECGNTRFLLQNFYLKEHAENCMMHLWVKDADAWWEHGRKMHLAEKYGVSVGQPTDRPWGMRDMTLIDPSGVLWRIGHEIKGSESTQQEK